MEYVYNAGNNLVACYPSTEVETELLSVDRERQLMYVERTNREPRVMSSCDYFVPLKEELFSVLLQSARTLSGFEINFQSVAANADGKAVEAFAEISPRLVQENKDKESIRFLIVRTMAQRSTKMRNKAIFQNMRTAQSSLPEAFRANIYHVNSNYFLH